MRETQAAWSRRSREPYDPSPDLRLVGEVLSADEAVPTLLRYPCPFGLNDWRRGQLTHLGPLGEALWLAEDLDAMLMAGPSLFGVIVVLEPMRLSPVRAAQPRCYRGANPVVKGHPLIWAPPSVVRADLPWDALRRPEEVREAYGEADFDAALASTEDQLSAYVEELSALAEAGVDGPDDEWCSLDADTRSEIIDRAGVTTRWTAA